MAGELNAPQLSARVRLERRDAAGPAFLLDLDIAVPAGITIVFGPSGAGKSTLLDCIAGLLQPNSGRITVGGDVLLDTGRGLNLPPPQRNIGYVFQTLALFPHMTVAANIGYGLARLPANERDPRVNEALHAFRVAHLSERKPSGISGGEKQRVALARALVTQPRVLLLDEPLTGLDAALKSSIISDLRNWNAAHRIPVLYVTHTREEVDALGERVVALDHGRIVGEGLPHEILDTPRRFRLAQAAGFENLFSGEVVELREADGVMRVRLGEGAPEIEVPLSHARRGDRVRVAVRAGDILLAAGRPSGLSARNVLEGRITSLEHRGAMVVTRVDCGVEFIVHVTPGAQRALQLGMGRPVWLVLKTHSCHLLAD